MNGSGSLLVSLATILSHSHSFYSNSLLIFLARASNYRLFYVPFSNVYCFHIVIVSILFSPSKLQNFDDNIYIDRLVHNMV